jgi:hypothetical protein
MYQTNRPLLVLCSGISKMDLCPSESISSGHPERGEEFLLGPLY